MNILVCVKIVSQATFSDSLSDSNERLGGGKLGINPADAYALELALRIKDKEKGLFENINYTELFRELSDKDIFNSFLLLFKRDFKKAFTPSLIGTVGTNKINLLMP